MGRGFTKASLKGGAKLVLDCDDSGDMYNDRPR